MKVWASGPRTYGLEWLNCSTFPSSTVYGQGSALREGRVVGISYGAVHIELVKASRAADGTAGIRWPKVAAHNPAVANISCSKILQRQSIAVVSKCAAIGYIEVLPRRPVRIHIRVAD
jgi:hypothetical protein